MLKVTVTPKDGKPVVKHLHTPQDAIEFINSVAQQPKKRPAKRRCPDCGNVFYHTPDCSRR